MGGGNDEAQAATPQPQANPAFTGQMRTFGMGQPTLVQQQLNQAGLGGIIDPSQYKATTAPIFTNPAQVAEYLRSKGMTPASLDPETPSTSTGENR